MNIRKLKRLLPDYDIMEHEVDSMDAVCNYYFEVTRTPSVDYRKQAIAWLLDNNIQFTSNLNVVYELFGMLVSVKCPVCGAQMKRIQGGGNGSTMSNTYRCGDDCRTEVTITTTINGISVYPRGYGGS